MAILAVVCLALGVSVLSGRPLGAALAGHLVLLAGFAALSLWLRQRHGSAWAPQVRGVAVICVMFLLYTTLGHVAFRAIPWLGDPALAALDRLLFFNRTSPAELAQGAGGGWVEGLSIFYAAFIPYLYMSILLGLIGRPQQEREEFVTGFVVLYALSFLGYLFVPARGPVVALADQLVPLAPGGTFHGIVLRSIESLGGPHGAFPSLHVGASCYAACFDLGHRNRLRGLIYLPLVAGIAIATIVLRYHYLVDLLAGALLAAVALRVAAAACRRGHAVVRPAIQDAGGPGYRLFRRAWQLCLALFFRRIDVQGLQHIPARGPVLLVANHSNAFVDGLLVLTRVPRAVSLTAKSTLRRNPLLRVLIDAMRVVEFHRAADKDADMTRNVAAMEECRRRLEAGGVLCIFPEGVSHSDPALRSFRTGAARVALDFIQNNPGIALPVVPLGLHYDAKERFRSTAALVAGEPLDVAAWRAAHPAGDARALTAEFEDRVRALTLNCTGEREVALLAQATELLAAAAAPAPAIHRDDPADVLADVRIMQRLQAGRDWLSAARAADLRALETGIEQLFRKLRRLGISVRELFLPLNAPRAAFFVLREAETLLVGAPLALWGAINHAVPYLLLRALVRKMSTDRDHFASNAVFLALPILPLCYALQTAAVWMLFGALPAVCYLVLLPLSAAVALRYRDRSGGTLRRMRTFLHLLRRPRHQQELTQECRSLAARIGTLATEFDERE